MEVRCTGLDCTNDCVTVSSPPDVSCTSPEIHVAKVLVALITTCQIQGQLYLCSWDDRQNPLFPYVHSWSTLDVVFGFPGIKTSRVHRGGYLKLYFGSYEILILLYSRRCPRFAQNIISADVRNCISLVGSEFIRL
ncbi:LOW QUALITY PROTEIN: hypothetical protein YC2023_036733 [Brassica napus]